MPLCRVFQVASGGLRVYHPNPIKRQKGESDRAFIERMGKDAVSKDETLAGLAWVDLDASALPERSQRCSECGNEHPVRGQWRLSGKKVSIDLKQPNPHRDYAHAIKALDAELDSENPDAIKALRAWRDSERAKRATFEMQ